MVRPRCGLVIPDAETDRCVERYRYNLNSFQVLNLLFLARSICSSLGLSEPPSDAKQKEHTSESLEKMRAYAGTYYLSTMSVSLPYGMHGGR